MMNLDYLDKYKLNWETFDILAGGLSSLDAKNFLSFFEESSETNQFLKGYGFDNDDPIQKAELFGIFQESLQFIRRYFLKEGNPEGLDIEVPERFSQIIDTSDLLVIASNSNQEENPNLEEMMWAGIILKVMHTILHTDKDLRYHYFSTIQTQIFDRFYKYLHRDEEDNLFLKSDDEMIELHEFSTKSKKSRESIIIKLLHKKENVAEEVFDRVGVRLITKNKFDAIRVMQFLSKNYIVMVNNIKPSRSQNSLIDFKKFREVYREEVKLAKEQELSEEDFINQMNTKSIHYELNANERTNDHSSPNYRAIHFTCRQLVKYRNPFLKKFNLLRNKVQNEDSSIAKEILNLDTSHIARDIRFFYPFEVQITDLESHQANTIGEASHAEYKKSQLKSARLRLFSQLLEYRKFKD